MLSREKKRTFRRVLFSRPALILLIIITILFARGVWGIWQKAHEARETRQNRAEELAQLKERKQTLTRSLEQLNTPRGIEAQLRRSYGMARPGEEVLILVETEQKSTSTQEKEEGGFFEWIRTLFWN